MLLSVNDLYTELLFPYLVEELKGNAQQPFILLMDGVRINDEHLSEYLRRGNSGCYCGIISDNVVDAIGSDENAFEICRENELFYFLQARNRQNGCCLV